MARITPDGGGGGGSGGGLSFTIGDGVATQYDLAHTFASLSVFASVARISDGAQSFPRIRVLDVNTVRVTFALPIATASYRVLIQKVA